MRASSIAALVLALGVTRTALAQCPDGSPPPCRGIAVTRTASPALNPKGWIVVPFTNVMRAAELDWLRDAAVNLMSFDMERWADIAVVPEKRVTDLVREASSGRAGQPLGLKDGLAIARRAGAGTLVMGDFFKTGTGARLVANVFDVRTGARIRTVTQPAPMLDSLMGAFGPLTRAVLALPPPRDAVTGDVGTGRVDAYQLYLQGTQARNRMQLLEAETIFRKALALDSTFALAHAELANVLAWARAWGGGSNASDTERLQHALSAERLGTRLPARARALIRASVAFARREWPAMCAAADPLVAADSTDIEAMFAAMSCRVRDGTLEPVGDSAWRFRGDPNVVLRLARASLRTDPGFFPAFDMLAQILLMETRYGCAPERTCAGLGQMYQGLLVMDGDTVVNLHPRDSVGTERQRARFSAQLREYRGRLLALKVVDDWVASAPANPWAHQARAEVLHLVGRDRESWQELHKVPITASPLNVHGMGVALEIAVRAAKGAEARAWYDSLVKATAGDSSQRVTLAWYDLFFGRPSRWRRIMDAEVVPALAKQTGISTDVLQRFRLLAVKNGFGLAVAELTAAESAVVFSPAAPPCSARCRAGVLNGAFREAGVRQRWLPDSIVLALDPGVRAVVTGDTATMRREAANQERFGRMAPTITGGGLVGAATLFKAAGDSASALRTVRFFLDSVYVHEFAGRRNNTLVIPTGALRTMVLRAELAAAMGYAEEAATWLDRVIDLWAEAEPEWLPDVARLRALRARIRLPVRP